MLRLDDLAPDRHRAGIGNPPATPPGGPRRPAYTLMEVIVVMTIMGVLIAIPAPLLARTVEQSRLDLAAANLRSIWSAQRYYYLENGRYGTIADLAAGTGTHDDLIDPSLNSGATFYQYTVAVSPDGGSFLATATHPDSPRCSGAVSIDDDGSLTGGVSYDGRPLTLSPEFAR